MRFAMKNMIGCIQGPEESAVPFKKRPPAGFIDTNAYQSLQCGQKARMQEALDVSGSGEFSLKVLHNKSIKYRAGRRRLKNCQPNRIERTEITFTKPTLYKNVNERIQLNVMI